MKRTEYAFMHSFANLLENGCTIRESLELLADEQTASDVKRIAHTLIDSLNKGESFSSEFMSTVIKCKKYHPYIQQLERTGNILSSLKLILEDMDRNNNSRNAFAQALLYPACIILIVSIYLGFLFVKGIPWMEDTGLIRDTAIIAEMRNGAGIAALFLVLTSIAGFVFATWIFRKKRKEYSFWAVLVSLTDSGFSFDQSLELCSNLSPLAHTHRGADNFFDSITDDLFSHTTLMTAKMTGDYPGAFKTILSKQQTALENLYALFGKLVEPAIMIITGCVLAILSVTVLLPLVTQNGGIV